MNAQSVIPSDILIPIDMWNKLKNIVPRKNAKKIRVNVFVIQFITLIIAEYTPKGVFVFFDSAG